MFGKALMRFQQKKFNESCSIFLRICELDPSQKRIGTYQAYVGQSYAALKVYDEAEEYLAKAYLFFRKNNFAAADKNEYELIHSTVNSYSFVLKKKLKNTEAKSITETYTNNRVKI